MEETKRQVLPAQILPNGLWVVATPIGNLGDLSPRVRMALESAHQILCEDTRRTAALLSAVGLQSNQRLHRLDAHTAESQMKKWIEGLLQGENYALVTDAGTPSVSDPGAVLVKLCHQAGIQVIPVPGPSAVTTLISASGFQATAFAFRGFFPRKLGEQKRELEIAAHSVLAPVCAWFESPHRIVETLKVLHELISTKSTQLSAEVVVGKELTKLYEKIFWGAPDEVYQSVKEEIEQQGEIGEWCFAVYFIHNNTSELSELGNGSDNSEQNHGWIKALKLLIDADLPPSDAAKRVSQEFGVPKKSVYSAALKISGKKSEEGG